MNEILLDSALSDAKKMIINCGNDTYQCNSAREFENVIRELLAKDSAEVWISETGGRDECPCIAVLVNESGAALNHFGNDGSCYSSFNGSEEDGFVTFCDDQYEVHSNQVISKEDTMTALLDFYRDKSRSSEIKWDQLY